MYPRYRMPIALPAHRQRDFLVSLPCGFVRFLPVDFQRLSLPPVRQLVILARNREQCFKAANRDVNVFSSSLPYQPDHAGNTAPGSGHQPGI